MWNAERYFGSLALNMSKSFCGHEMHFKNGLSYRAHQKKKKKKSAAMGIYGMYRSTSSMLGSF